MEVKQRTCTNCVKSKLCFAYKDLMKILSELPAARSKFDTPGTDAEVVESLARACREYQEKKI